MLGNPSLSLRGQPLLVDFRTNEERVVPSPPPHENGAERHITYSIMKQRKKDLLTHKSDFQGSQEGSQ